MLVITFFISNLCLKQQLNYFKNGRHVSRTFVCLEFNGINKILFWNYTFNQYLTRLWCGEFPKLESKLIQHHILWETLESKIKKKHSLHHFSSGVQIRQAIKEPSWKSYLWPYRQLSYPLKEANLWWSPIIRETKVRVEQVMVQEVHLQVFMRPYCGHRQDRRIYIHEYPPTLKLRQQM